jgi:hypothetical protein
VIDFDLEGVEPVRLRSRTRCLSATIVADVKRFSHQINTDEVFGTHRSGMRSIVPEAHSSSLVIPASKNLHKSRHRSWRKRFEPASIVGRFGEDPIPECCNLRQIRYGFGFASSGFC